MLNADSDSRTGDSVVTKIKYNRCSTRSYGAMIAILVIIESKNIKLIV